VTLIELAALAVFATQFVPPPVEMEEEQVVVKKEELGTSKLVLIVTEGATVYLGKKKLGVAPIADTMEVIEGRHLIKVKLGDSTFTEWVEVPPGGTFTYRLSVTDGTL
jgi:hypothetical protein